MASNAISFLRIGRRLRSGNATFWECTEETRFRVWRVCQQWVARAIAGGMQPQLHAGQCPGHHTSTDSILIMATDGVVKAAGVEG